METDVAVRRVSDGLQLTLRRLASLAGGIAVVIAETFEQARACVLQQVRARRKNFAVERIATSRSLMIR